MKQMRTMIAVILGGLMILGLAACGSGNGASGSQTADGNTAQTQTGGAEEQASEKDDAEEPVTEPTEEEAADDAGAAATDSTESPDAAAGAGEGRVLVVYYSATGHTADVAGYIANATGGDPFELVPVEAYSSDDLDWTDEDSRVVHEHDNPDARAVELAASTVDNWEEYDTIFVGYPKLG